MKTMTCKQLAGACDVQFHANTWEEMALQSQNHGAEMFAKKDAPHLEAMNNMMKIMSDPNAMQKWMDEKRKEFDSLPEDK
ncbi:DUF1059 domain-containing protein [Candidatus Microgenomates bacterium]|nr:DUF1059 domain-containing protein [Candidatus Microgenomates bacterium]